MLSIVFESHATTFDNEKKLASGHYDVELSPVGIQNAIELGQRRSGDHFDAIFTSDLQRAYKTAQLAFGERFPIIRDERLRECDYGAFEHRPNTEIENERINRITQSFPDGESYEQCMVRMKSFLYDLRRDYAGKHILVIGHRATQYGLEHYILGTSLVELATTQWQWQPGWAYELDETKPLRS